MMVLVAGHRHGLGQLRGGELPAATTSGRARGSGEAARRCLEAREKAEKPRDALHGLAGLLLGKARTASFRLVSSIWNAQCPGAPRTSCSASGGSAGPTPVTGFPGFPWGCRLRNPETRADLDRCPPAGSCQQLQEARREALSPETVRSSQGARQSRPGLLPPPALLPRRDSATLVWVLLFGRRGARTQSACLEKSGADFKETWRRSRTATAPRSGAGAARGSRGGRGPRMRTGAPLSLRGDLAQCPRSVCETLFDSEQLKLPVFINTRH